eukprot:10592308-Ditylum_brightwellii.AAC.1
MMISNVKTHIQPYYHRKHRSAKFPMKQGSNEEQLTRCAEKHKGCGGSTNTNEINGKRNSTVTIPLKECVGRQGIYWPSRNMDDRQTGLDKE